MKIAIVILNWNGKKYLEQFLPFVLKYNSADAEIIIADNASTDNSIEFLHTNYPQLKIIRNEKNDGFAKGYNDALAVIASEAKQSYEYYILLNSDIEVSENWINPLISVMDKDATIAAVQPKIKSFYHRNYFEHAGAAGGFIDKYGFVFCRGRIFNTVEEDRGQYDDAKEIFWATGACLFIRADAFHKAGGFDEDFFAHMEEIDLCWRLKNMNYKIMYSPNSTVYHIGGGTLQYSSPIKTYLNFRNNLYLLYKNLPSESLFKIFFIRLILDGIAAIKFIFERNHQHFPAVIKAHFRFYKNFKMISKKRKALNNQRKHEDIFDGSIIAEYFLKGKKYFSEIK